MPLFEYKCDNGHVFEKLVRQPARPNELELCQQCVQKNSDNAKYPVSLHPLMAKLQISSPSKFVWGSGGGWN